tara:strand:+ start:2946 stop:3809 length:864 start_codon:yes stop_codon:yes gene_type:complete
MTKSEYGQTGMLWTWANDKWYQGNPAVIGPNDQGFWLSATVFDGARAIAGSLPDLDLHCQRAVRSAEILGLKAPVSVDQIMELAREGTAKFPSNAELYISPIFYAQTGFVVEPNPESTRFLMVVQDAPLPEPVGFSACLSKFRRPSKDSAPTEAKASCLYPNVARSVAEAKSKGFDTGVVLDPNGNVAEFSYANLFMSRNNIVSTPSINGTFLNGITRQRVIQLLKDDGITVEERAIDIEELIEADELFSTGNYAKVMPCIRFDDKVFSRGPIMKRARELYFEFSSG